MKDLKNYYFTFGSKYLTEKHPNYPKANPYGYVVIKAKDYLPARKKAEEVFGIINNTVMYSFMYDDDNFNAKYFPAGVIETIIVE